PEGLGVDDVESQNELLFSILVGRREEGSAFLCDPRVFCPVIAVDSGASIISGREVVGYPKMAGTFSGDGLEAGWIAVKGLDRHLFAVTRLGAAAFRDD